MNVLNLNMMEKQLMVKKINILMYDSDVDKDKVKEYGVKGFPTLFLKVAVMLNLSLIDSMKRLKIFRKSLRPSFSNIIFYQGFDDYYLLL